MNGFPASFQLRYDRHDASGPYGFNDLVTLRPRGCPPVAYRYSEEVVSSANPTGLQSDGSLGILRFGFAADLTGRRSAVLSMRYYAASCSGKLTWHLHPAHRRPVQDGRWRLRFGDAETSTFRVTAGGRLATGISIPSELTRCNGVSGHLDLFIASNRQAKLAQPNVATSVRFSLRHANGQFDGGGPGCPGGPFRFSASPAR